MAEQAFGIKEFNLIGSGTGPITGNELVEIVVLGPDEKEYTYYFRVYKVGDRVNSGKVQKLQFRFNFRRSSS